MASVLLGPLGPDSLFFTLKADEQAENFRSDSVNHLPRLLLEPVAHLRQRLAAAIGFRDALRR